MHVSRRALLIESSKAKGQKEIAGCRRDVERLQSWLGNVVGGAWNASEITILHDPTRKEIDDAKKLAFGVDFAFLAFSGHGRIIEDWTGNRKQKIIIGTGEEIDFNDLLPSAKKAIHLCDACREIHRPAALELSVNKAMQKYARFSESTGYSRADYRAVYDQWVDSARGTYTMYSCTAGQCAGDDPLNGGVFTGTLLDLSGRWYEAATKSAVLSVDAALNLTKPVVGAASRRADADSPQDPSGTPSARDGTPFPFAIALV